jgi:uncharacterized membrane protein
MKGDLIIFIIAFSSVLANFIIFDIILKIQRKKYNEIWKDEGEIIGFFEFGKGNFPFITEQINRSARFFSWTFFNSDWMKNELKIIWLLRIVRFNFLLFISVWLYGIVNLSAK